MIEGQRFLFVFLQTDAKVELVFRHQQSGCNLFVLGQ